MQHILPLLYAWMRVTDQFIARVDAEMREKADSKTVQVFLARTTLSFLPPSPLPPRPIALLFACHLLPHSRDLPLRECRDERLAITCSRNVMTLSRIERSAPS